MSSNTVLYDPSNTVTVAKTATSKLSLMYVSRWMLDANTKGKPSAIMTRYTRIIDE